MKTFKKVLFFCDELTFYKHHKIERVIELNHVRECIIKVFSKIDKINEHLQIGVQVIIHDISLMVKNRNDENNGEEIKNVRVCILQVLCLQTLFREKADE